MDEAGLVEHRPQDERRENRVMSRQMTAESYLSARLTWTGHEFLEAPRNDGIWKQAKEAAATVGGITLPMWIKLLTKLAAERLGLPTE